MVGRLGGANSSDIMGIEIYGMGYLGKRKREISELAMYIMLSLLLLFYYYFSSGKWRTNSSKLKGWAGHQSYKGII